MPTGVIAVRAGAEGRAGSQGSEVSAGSISAWVPGLGLSPTPGMTGHTRTVIPVQTSDGPRKAVKTHVEVLA